MKKRGGMFKMGRSSSGTGSSINPKKDSLGGPELEYWNLDNGTSCVAAHIPDAPLTCIDFWCKAGSSNEQAGEEGLAHFLEHMIF